MKIGIIGAGFTGLAAAYYLTLKGHEVEVFERDANPGGLAIGYQEKDWKWTLEQHYHHWFTNDKSVIELAKQINHKVVIKRPKTSSFVESGIYQLDSPVSLLKFSRLSIFDRLRVGASIASLRYNPIWKPLEKFHAEPYLKATMGRKGYQKIFEPLMVNKLGKYSEDVSLAWFWARVYKRTPSLAYPEGGFLEFAKHLEKEIKKQKGKIYYNTEVVELKSKGEPEIKVKNEGETITKKFDKVIVTLPSFLFQKISPSLPPSYTNRLKKLKGIGAMNLVLRLKKPFLTDGTYWLNMSDLNSDILAIVEHTNFMNKKNYNNEHLLYIGNYMPADDPRFSMSEKEILNLYDPWLKKVNPNYKKNIIGYKLFKAPFAQPIITPNYSRNIPPTKTPLENVYLVNIEQVYPWDRGTNYSVELGKKAADKIIQGTL
jgi:protoporphyrinogen oxidase